MSLKLYITLVIAFASIFGIIIIWSLDDKWSYYPVFENNLPQNENYTHSVAQDWTSSSTAVPNSNSANRNSHFTRLLPVKSRSVRSLSDVKSMVKFRRSNAFAPAGRQAGNNTNASTISPGTEIPLIIDPEIIALGCVPPGKDPPPDLPDIPPCPPTQPTTKEPTPPVDYTGSLNFGNINCLTADKIAEIQISNKPLPEKSQELEAKACDRTKGLECFDLEEIGENNEKVLVPTCRCASAFGRPTSERLNINGMCYIPVGKGEHSDCQDNSLCVPNSSCRENSQWFGRRCVCDRGFLAEQDGRCSRGIPVVIVEGTMFWVLISSNLIRFLTN